MPWGKFMTKKTVLMHFSQVGGFNSLKPLIDRWDQDFPLVITGRRQVCEHLQKRGVPVSNYDELGIENPMNSSDWQWFTRIAPGLVITDTINLSRVRDGAECRYFWSAARHFGVPSIAYVDCWWGYDERFLLPGEASPPILPGCIAVIDEIAKQEMASRGYPEQKLWVSGSPWFQHLSTLARQYDDIEKKKMKTSFGIAGEKFVILFVSQPLEKTFGSEEVWGFTEITTFTALLAAIADLPFHLKEKIAVVILVHPEEDIDRLAPIAVRCKETIDIHFLRDNNPIDAVLMADLVTGMYSILLAEAVILRRPVISIQLNLQREEVLVTNTIGASVSINKQEELFEQLSMAVSSSQHRKQLLEKQEKFKIVTDAQLRWERVLEE
jgi:hypothetical protein